MNPNSHPSLLMKYPYKLGLKLNQDLRDAHQNTSNIKNALPIANLLGENPKRELQPFL